MKTFQFLILLSLISSSVIAQEMFTEEEIKTDQKLYPARLHIMDGSEKSLSDLCKEGCSQENIMDVFNLKTKLFVASNQAQLKYNALPANADILEKSLARSAYFEAATQYMEVDAKLKQMQLDVLKKRYADAAKEAAVCKKPVEEASLTVNDSNRSFFKKLSDIFSFKREGGPAPIEDRSTNVSK